MTIQEEAEFNRRLADIARRQNLDPSILKEILYYSSRGLNQSEIARTMGIPVEKVAAYINALGNMEKNDFWRILFYIAVTVGGLWLLDELTSKGDQVPETPPKAKIREENIKKAKDLHKQGFSTGEIAKALGISRATAYRYIQDENSFF